MTEKHEWRLLVGVGVFIMWILYYNNNDPRIFSFGVNPSAFRIFALVTLPAFIAYFLLSYWNMTKERKPKIV